MNSGGDSSRKEFESMSFLEDALRANAASPAVRPALMFAALLSAGLVFAAAVFAALKSLLGAGAGSGLDEISMKSKRGTRLGSGLFV